MPAIKQTDVCLICPPFTLANGPSLALGLLKAALLQNGISCYVDYADLYMLAALGADLYHFLNYGSGIEFEGEYIFCKAAGIEPNCTFEEVAAYSHKRRPHLPLSEIKSRLLQAEDIVNDQTEAVLHRVFARHPKIIGITSAFQQRNAALALCRRIKEQHPEVVTVMGGPNCFGSTGIRILWTFPYVDYVFFGEADDIFPSVCKNIMDENPLPLPYGVLGQKEPLPETAPHRILTDLNCLPFPDYNDYYDLMGTDIARITARLAESAYVDHCPSILFMESSRGCWWAEKEPCTFCGLHGTVRQFRSKSPDRAYDEFCYLTKKYPASHIWFTDCLMPTDWPKTFVKRLVRHPEKYNLFHEVRSHYSENEIKSFAEAGFKRVQAGIESLSDHELTLMHKGTTMLQNLNFLKFCRQYDIIVTWNILYGFPGETVSDYEEQKALLPLIQHFDPPVNCIQLLYARGGTYTEDPDRYGLKLRPADYFRLISPKDQAYINDIACYFDSETDLTDDIRKAAKSLSTEVVHWKNVFTENGRHIRLDVVDLGDKLLIVDTRECRALRLQYLIGAEREIYRLIKSPVRIEDLVRKLQETYSEGSILTAIRSLAAKKLILRHRGKVFALATRRTKEELKVLEISEFQELLKKSKKIRSLLAESEKNFMADRAALLDAKKFAVSQMADKLRMCFTADDYLSSQRCSDRTI